MLMAIIFFILLLLPILRIKSDLLNLLSDSISDLLHGGVNPRLHDSDVSLIDLPIIRFHDLQDRRRSSVVDRMCFICSGDYDKDDVVCQLGRCGHVFHSDCVAKMLHRRQGSCPFCHSPVFAGMMSPEKVSGDFGSGRLSRVRGRYGRIPSMGSTPLPVGFSHMLGRNGLVGLPSWRPDTTGASMVTCH
ncbi:hypothetical protein OSB04_025707 [Centaurea solstitialis]|uniref:RING-type domain-containing protein n=1 Tax=Centaurea solstitialis TaxID=347529 RepID=A0AA38SNK1_9ASTR|nr:hypothetical protein OSB04_025707 [Centaurea solstitialis]